MESPPPAVFHDKYERTQQGNLLGGIGQDSEKNRQSEWIEKAKKLWLTFLMDIESEESK